MPSSLPRQKKRQWIQLMLALGLFGVALGGAIYHGHTRAIEEETEKLRASTRAADENLSRQLEALNAALGGVRQDLPFFAKGNFQEALLRRLSALSTAFPGVRTLLVVDASGQIVASNKPETIGLKVTQRPYFQQLKMGADPGSEHFARLIAVGNIGGLALYVVEHHSARSDGTDGTNALEINNLRRLG